jgi:hypothetical protein
METMMFRLIQGGKPNTSQDQQVAQDVAAFLDQRFVEYGPDMSGLDRWTQLRIGTGNRQKLAGVFASDDPPTRCYRNLVREIDTEAEAGIYLSAPAGGAARLRMLTGESGLTGRLHQHLPEIAASLCPNDFVSSAENVELAVATMQSRFERANIDAEVSELILMHLLHDEDEVADTADSLRALFYAYHEHRARCRFDLPRHLGDQASRRIAVDVANLRNGSVTLVSNQ